VRASRREVFPGPRGFFSTLSLTIAGIVLNRDRLMGIGQVVTMPLFFASNALDPIGVMPAWLQALSTINPLRHEIDAPRGLLIGTPSNVPEDLLCCWLLAWSASRPRRDCCKG
jgi:ABC-type multidrug transport system permease subunit